MTPKTSLANSILNLNQIIQPIIGEICHQIAFSYGDELQLHFGKMTAYNHPKLSHLRKGSWQLSTRATPWYLMLEKGVSWSSSMLVNNENAVELAKIQLQCLENTKLTNFVILANSNDMKLTLSFQGDLDYELILEPDLEDDSGLAYWELMMPNEQILTVGPGMFWECKSIHERY